jgi:uncharacterized protein YkwD
MKHKADPRPRRWLLPTLIAAAAIAVLATTVGTIATEQAIAPRRVDPSTVKITPRPDPVSITAPIEKATAAASADVVDETATFAYSFAQDLVSARTTWTKKPAANVEASVDDCLTGWAREHVLELATAGTYDVVDACGRRTVVVAGKAGVDDRVLVYRALEDGTPDAVRDVLLSSTSTSMVFAAVRSADGAAVLMAAAAP